MLKGNLSNPSGPHLSYENFARFEETIFSFLKTYPHVFSVKPTTLASTTFAARLRDAINAHLTHRFESKVDPDALASAWSGSILTRNSDTVILGPKAAVAAASRQPLAEASAGPRYLIELSEPTLDQLNALAFLYATNAISEPSFVGAIPPGYKPLANTSLTPYGSGFILL